MSYENFKEKLEAEGCRLSWIQIKELGSIKEELLTLKENGSIEAGLYEKEFVGFRFDTEDLMSDAKSVLLIAAPQHKTELIMEWENEKRTILVPPIYCSEESEQKAAELAEHFFLENGKKGVRVRLPLKLLAAKTGLSEYGRNNISYIAGMGSYYRLMAWLTDFEAPENTTCKEPERMAACEHCRSCVEHCPTKCISPDRKIIHAERCLTNMNEYVEQIPEWVDPKWHNALLGCMRCQEYCPQNRGLLKTYQYPKMFKAEETKAITEAKKFSELPSETREKLTELGLEDYVEGGILGRNLKLLL